ncbi:Uncharacterized protein HZ326_6130 [Fusarium oxysporum f. sp. albedinis]|nr:Uncharacterized protein HZ326_6130 [Fusarium oxysporum f. sp. albedinis]
MAFHNFETNSWDIFRHTFLEYRHIKNTFTYVVVGMFLNPIRRRRSSWLRLTPRWDVIGQRAMWHTALNSLQWSDADPRASMAHGQWASIPFSAVRQVPSDLPPQEEA